MTFNSIPFFLFFLCIFLINYIISPKSRWILGLIGSFIFYSLLDFKSIGILVFSNIVDFYIGLSIGKNTHNDKKKFLLIFSLFMNILFIFGFKYLNLFSSSLLAVINIIFDLNYSIPSLDLLLPLGISFYSFKKMSYNIDIYKGKIKPEKHIGYFFLYVCHFLEITSGPIDRAKDLLPQIKNPKQFDYNKIRHGFLLILWGVFMKVVIADRLSIYTDAIFGNVYHHNGPSLLLAVYFYSFQIYCDFAGYTNIAIGCGLMLGLEFKQNFDLPYFAISISDFWRRWHITLSFWFRDYLYIPLGGNRVSLIHRCFNTMIVFLLCGLWHGANWTFVIWGGIHGTYIAFALVTKKLSLGFGKMPAIEPTIQRVIRIIIVFHLVSFAWIFFRAQSLAEALYYVSHLFNNWPNLFIDSSSITYGIFGVGCLVFVEILKYNKLLSIERFFNFPILLRWGVLYILIFLITLLGVGSDGAFIYNQF